MSLPLPQGYSRARSEAAEQRLFQAMATVNAAASPTHGLGAKPVGLVNDGNTCFFNSTFQALAATTSLINLLSPVIFPAEEHTTTEGEAAKGEVPDVNTPAHTTTGLATGSDGSHLLPSAIPSLQDSAVEPENAKLMPVTLTFERCLGRAWRAKDSAVMSTQEYKSLVANANSTDAALPEAAGTNSVASSRRNSLAERKAADATISIGPLLKELAKKYDQYDGYRQQDAHEVLRHLLDSMSMEEKDFIKKLQPPSPDRARKQRKGGRDPMASTEEDENKLIPFADALFGGSLVSVVICESCKNVSHTYEGFLDISLSMREQAPRARKRDKFKAIASKFKPGRSHSPGSQSQHSDQLSSSMYLEGVHPEPSDTDGFMDETPRNASDMEKSLEIGTVPSKSEAPIPLRKRSSLTSWAGKKRTSRPSTTSSVDSLQHDSQGSLGLDHSIASLRASASIRSSSHNSFGSAISEEPSYVISPPKPTPEQAAYIRRLLNGPNLPPKDDPLEKLRQGMANMSAAEGANGTAEQHPTHRPYVAGQDTDLMDCLKNFSAVEVLEGDNAFACHKCWQYKTGKVKRKASDRRDSHGILLEEDEEREEERGRDSAGRPHENSTAASVTFASTTAANAQIPAIAVTETDGQRVVPATIGHEATDKVPLTATISPRPSETMTLSSGISGYSSSEEDSSDEGQGRISITRPAMPQRRHSTHYVLRRAFKRYMIARAPPVLVFHFKRFRPPSKSSNMYAASFASLKKSDEFISFPDLLDLSPFIAPSRSDYKITIGPDGVGRAPYMEHPSGDMGPELTPMRYKLYSVVVHVGASAISGHYIAYVLVDPGVVLDINRKRLVNDMGMKLEEQDHSSSGIAAAGVAISNKAEKEDNRVWCYCSDTQIRLATIDEVMQAKAYLCFYEKCD
ncbi:hypothetical protein QFC22_004129 [Naganishia vaughanmartiniae]|uniref:Uncharacterized protein n=1 Tax=Naganishia vaughanmartiniae TaxID=1424756 RepID=A0ACC2X2V5_9TREE|nr:hypothetical protein QFC22_004129 [Naganishia vaughanmartiniae]